MAKTFIRFILPSFLYRPVLHLAGGLLTKENLPQMIGVDFSFGNQEILGDRTLRLALLKYCLEVGVNGSEGVSWPNDFFSSLSSEPFKPVDYGGHEMLAKEVLKYRWIGEFFGFNAGRLSWTKLAVSLQKAELINLSEMLKQRSLPLRPRLSA